MKKIVILIFALSLCLTSFAQREKPKEGQIGGTNSGNLAKDIKWFENKTPEQIIAVYGNPSEKDLSGIMNSDYMADYVLFYEHFTIYMNKISDNSRSAYIESFSTDSPEFAVLTDVYPGGIRVGSKISDIKAFNFAATAHANKGNKNNNLIAANLECGFGHYPEHYMIYSLEYHWIGIDAENGIVRSWGYFSKADNDNRFGEIESGFMEALP